MLKMFTSPRDLERLLAEHHPDDPVDLRRGELYTEIVRAATALQRAAANAYRVETVQVQPNFGTNGSIDTLLMATMLRELDAGTRGGMLVATPTYYYTCQAAMNRRLRVHAEPLDENFALDAAKFVRRIHAEQPSLVMLVTPNNPTGTPIPDADLLHIIDETPDDTWIAVDRTLVNTAPEISTRALLERCAHKNVAVLHSFSKYKSFSHLRIGISVFSNPAMARAALPVMPLGVPLEGCIRAAAAIVEEGEIRPNADVVARIDENQAVLREFAQRHGIRISHATGNFVVVVMPEGLSSTLVTKSLAGCGIDVMDGMEFPHPDDRIIRVHMAGPVARLHAGLQHLATLLDEHRDQRPRRIST